VFKRILVVCVGNICRSPMAEALLSRALNRNAGGVEVRSAGLGALVGHPADEIARTLMQQRGVDISAHRARQLEPEMLRSADLVLVMEQAQKLELASVEPQVRGKLFLLGHWTGEEIPDPYQRGVEVFAEALGSIDRAVTAWVSRIAR
jgi:protein-tyrosine phosphatase